MADEKLLSDKVNLFVVGGQKCGTSALAYYLSCHPEVGVAREKEVHYFDAPEFDLQAFMSPARLDAYFAESFDHEMSCRYWCDATPIYLFLPECLARIQQYNPDAKMIALTRNPCERAFSQYRMNVRYGIEKRSFFMALLLEPFRLLAARGGRGQKSALRLFSYVSRGLFVEQIERMCRLFPAQNVLIIENADLLNQHDETLTRVWRFLGVQRLHIPFQKVFEGTDGRALRRHERGAHALMQNFFRLTGLHRLALQVGSGKTDE